MFGLFYREFIMQRRNLILLGGAYLLMIIILFLPKGTDYINTISNSFDIPADALIVMWIAIILVVSFIFIGLYQSTIFEIDEKRKWAEFLCSTPLTGKGMVAGKYYFTLFISFILVSMNWVVTYIANVVYQQEFYYTDMLVILFYVQLILRAMEYPYIVRYGTKNGGNYKGIFFLVIVMLVIIYVLFGDLSYFGSINNMIDSLADSILAKDKTEGMMTVMAVLPYVSIAAFYISYRISVKLYDKGVECYDK